MAAIAHVSIGLASKRAVPNVPLWVLIACTCLLDVLYFILFFLGIEISDNPFWSHSLLMAVIWSALASLIAESINHDGRTSLFIGLLVFSHWIVDFITWPTGVPLFPFEGSGWISLGLFNPIYNSQIGIIIGIVVVEFGSLIFGIGIYFLTWKRLKREKELATRNQTVNPQFVLRV
ncbi:MAG: metal-dependent hydrolase [Candidatus Odinarchaeota archaeon]